MPNIIAIVDDNRVRGQIESYFKEMDAEGIRLRFFTTGYEFEQKYFAHKKTAKTHPLHEQPGFEKLTFEQIESTLAIPLNTKPALPHSALRLQFNLKSHKITGLEPQVDANQTTFGWFPEDLANQTNLFSQILLPEFLSLWQGLLKQLTPKRQELTLAMKTADKSAGWFKVGIQKMNQDVALIDISEVTDKYRDPISAELTRRQSQQEESDELQLLSEIDLVIFKNDCISGKAPKWLDQTWKHLKEGGYFPKANVTRFVLLKYEDDGISKLDVLHPRLDDLIYLPLDRLIFLQKFEILIGLPKKVSPSFLFTQEVDISIEISKLSKLERLSDLGLAIRNPVRLTNGLLGHFYLTLPEAEEPLDMWGKVIHSEPHPERKNEYLVYFSFFGLRKNDGALLKRYMAQSARFATFIKAEREAFELNPEDLFVLEEDKRTRHVAVLTLDEAQAQQIKTSLPKDIAPVKVVTESSFAAFVNRFLSTENAQLAGPPSGAGVKDLYASALTLTVRVEDLEMVTNESPPGEGALYFGNDAVQALATPEGWLKPLVAYKGNQELLTELVALAASGVKIHRVLTAVNTLNEGKIIKLTVEPGQDGKHVQITLNLPTPEDLKAKLGGDRIESLDLVIVDLALVPSGNVNALIQNLSERVEQLSLNKSGKSLKFILSIDNEKQLRHHEWSNPQLMGIISKPTEMRPLSFLAAKALESNYSIYRFDNMGWLHTLLPIHVAKEIQLEMLSEFGAALRHTRPITPGSVLFLRGGIFDNAPNRCLAARFYHCEEHSSEKGQFLCTAIYFGINDAFMKYARRWFRETYASSKQQSES